ncbi:hypothetical protein GGR66_001486 [Xanthomonas sp. 3498]|nr:hypothetical protein [Xanthomonas sp. 3498]
MTLLLVELTRGKWLFAATASGIALATPSLERHATVAG